MTVAHLPAKRQRNSRAPQIAREVPAHRAWVRLHNCSVPGCLPDPAISGTDAIEAARTRRGGDSGVGLKPHDRWCISLCAAHHARQHQVGELTFEAETGIDMVALAMIFASRSPHRAKLEAKV